ncbi:putative ureidoglycolate hydrolase [Tanacetum coccineum]
MLVSWRRCKASVFKISGPKFMKLDMGTWHAGPLFESHGMDFYNLELSNTNLSSSTECLTSIVLWDATYLIPFSLDLVYLLVVKLKKREGASDEGRPRPIAIEKLIKF